jgi:hypothetical protein
LLLSPFLTNDKSILYRVLNEELWLSHFTALWTGIKKAMDSLTNELGRRVVVVLTDGADSCQLGIHDIWTQFPTGMGKVTDPIHKIWMRRVGRVSAPRVRRRARSGVWTHRPSRSIASCRAKSTDERRQVLGGYRGTVGGRWLALQNRSPDRCRPARVPLVRGLCGH